MQEGKNVNENNLKFDDDHWCPLYSIVNCSAVVVLVRAGEALT